MIARLFFLITFSLTTSIAWSQVPLAAVGVYHISSFSENGKPIPMKNYGALWNNSYEINNRSTSYVFSFHTGDDHLCSVDTIGFYEARYYGIRVEDLVILKNDIVTTDLTTTIDAQVHWGSCDRKTKTIITVNKSSTWVKINSEMQLCNGQKYLRELEMQR